MKKTFENIGQLIIRMAVWIFAIEVIAAFVGGIAIMYVDESMIVVGLLTIVLGLLVSWVSFCLLVGYGELINRTCENEGHNRQILQLMMDMKKNEDSREPISKIVGTQVAKQPQSAENANDSLLAQPSEKPKTDETLDKDIPVVAEIVDGMKVCPKCGRSQKADRSVCWKCGQKFEN